ncbi:MAG: hypothetical protein V3T58_02485 [Candidatus Hydrothermarchaeales archaeon]
MDKAEEEKVLEKLSRNFKELNATELSTLIKRAPAEVRRQLEKPYREKMRISTEAEELLNEGRVCKAMELLNYAIPLGYFGNEYSYGVLGDAYMKQDDRTKALEMYKKSGSIDSLKNIRIYGLE